MLFLWHPILYFAQCCCFPTSNPVTFTHLVRHKIHSKLFANARAKESVLRPWLDTPGRGRGAGFGWQILVQKTAAQTNRWRHARHDGIRHLGVHLEPRTEQDPTHKRFKRMLFIMTKHANFQGKPPFLASKQHLNSKKIRCRIFICFWLSCFVFWCPVTKQLVLHDCAKANVQGTKKSTSPRVVA